MMYVEWLRVRNVTRVLAIVLGVFILITLVLRISVNGQLNVDARYNHMFVLGSHATVTDSVLPDGTKRKTIVDAAHHRTVTIDNLGYRGYHIVLTEPVSHGGVDHVPPVGSMHVTESIAGNVKTTTVDTNGPTPFLYYMLIADAMAFVIATLLATPFARENDGHLEFALTKPVSRTTLALGIIGVDLAGIVLCSFMTVVAAILCQAMFELPQFDFSGINMNAIVMGFIFPFAWYAMVNAATASLSRGYGAIQGFAWPVAILVTVFALMPWGNSVLGEAVHGIFWVVSRIDPLSYLSTVKPDQATGQLVAAPEFGIRALSELLLFAVYSVLAVLQWRRVEA